MRNIIGVLDVYRRMIQSSSIYQDVIFVGLSLLGEPPKTDSEKIPEKSDL